MFPTLHHPVGTLGSSGSSRVVLRNRSRMTMRAVVVVVGGGQGGRGCRPVQLWRRSFWRFFRKSKLAPAKLRIDFRKLPFHWTVSSSSLLNGVHPEIYTSHDSLPTHQPFLHPSCLLNLLIPSFPAYRCLLLLPNPLV
jgi:hypothetical protein